MIGRTIYKEIVKTVKNKAVTVITGADKCAKPPFAVSFKKIWDLVT